MTPFLFKCSRCGKRLRAFSFEEYALMSKGTNHSNSYTFLDYVLISLKGTCPHCGHKLQVPPAEVEVKTQ